MALVGIAQDTVRIVTEGTYTAPSGASVDIASAVRDSIANTTLLRPPALGALVAALEPARGGGPPRIEVTREKTDDAGRRLVESEGEPKVLALNYASAKNPGGGFLRGAKAQEEDLARCSALYTCQLTQRAYYDENRACGSMLYTDHMIYSPAVPFFRDSKLELLERPFLLSIVTSPAPNAGEYFRTENPSAQALEACLAARAKGILALAVAKGYRALVLGAWGCGVFRNDPKVVARTFAELLASPAFAGAFSRVVFAVYDRSAEGATYAAFRDRFANA